MYQRVPKDVSFSAASRPAPVSLGVHGDCAAFSGLILTLISIWTKLRSRSIIMEAKVNYPGLKAGACKRLHG
jgi:type IV secretory pathway VirB3-like protein